MSPFVRRGDIINLYMFPTLCVYIISKYWNTAALIGHNDEPFPFYSLYICIG